MFFIIQKRKNIIEYICIIIYLLLFWSDRLLDIVTTTKKGYIIWQEVFDNGVKVTKELIM